MTKFVFALLLCTVPSLALAQGAIQQSGPVTPYHNPLWVQNGVQKDAGGANGGPAGTNPSEQGITATGTGTAPYASQGTGPNGENWCDYDAPTTNATGYHYLCLSPNAQGGGLISYGAGGAATPGSMQIRINGTNYPLPNAGGAGNVTGPGSSISNDYACFNGTNGMLLKDCGFGTLKSTVSVASGSSGAVTSANAQVTITGLTSVQYAGESVTITWASMATTSLIQATWAGGTSVGVPVIKVVAGSGSLTLTLTNVGSATFNGTAIINLSILP